MKKCSICQVNPVPQDEGICSTCRTGMEQIGELVEMAASPVIHWGLPQYLWDGKGMCGVECLPEHTSVGQAITCPDCLRLFREQTEKTN